MIARSVLEFSDGAAGPVIADDPDWRGRARCAEVDGDAFFPEQGATTRLAKRICQGCEVREPCLQFALDNDIRFGIFGGLSETERRAVKRERRRAGLAEAS